jgi:predicted dehydrogenase
MTKFDIQQKVLRIVVVGYGYWGPNIARNVHQYPGCALAAVCDLSPQRQEAARHVFDRIPVVDSVDDLNPQDFDAVVIATPAHTHASLALQAINLGKHILIEKPIAPSVAEALEIVKAADAAGVTLMVDHTFVFSSAVQRMREEVDQGSLGSLVYFDSTRVNLGIFQPDVSVLWDLAVHDLSILTHLVNERPIQVSATVGRHEASTHPAIGSLTLTYESAFFAHINVSWLSPMKHRRTILSGTKRTAVFDDLLTDEKLKIYEASVERTVNEEGLSALLNYRTGDVISPRLPAIEPLRLEIENFCLSAQTAQKPMTSGESAVQIAAILEAAHESANTGGEPKPIVFPL